MEDKIRLIKENDHAYLAAFWALNGVWVDPKTCYPAGSSYVYERNNKPLYALAVYRIEGIPLGYLEVAIRDPNKEPDFEAFSALIDFVENQCKEFGIRVVVASAKTDKLLNHYSKLGYNIDRGQTLSKCKELN